MMQGRRGVAMFSVLTLMGVLIVMVVALVRLVTHQSFESKTQHDQLAATYVAEAGVAHVLEALDADPSWVEGFDAVPTAGGRGTYSVRFNTSGASFATTDSVNNLGKDVTVDGPRGRDSIPPDSAVVVVTGRVGIARRDLELVIRQKGLTSIKSPLLASGPIRLQGPTVVSGVESLDGVVSEGQIHSNFTGAAGPTISWAPLLPGDRASVEGKVTAVDPRPVAEAIDFGPDGGYTVGGLESDASPAPMPSIDVASTVQSNAGHPAPIIGAGTTTIGAGNWYLSNGMSVNGDLILAEDAQVFVRGNVSINGSINGEGSVYAEGDVHFYGDATINSANRLAVLSSGDLHLQGFDGTAFLKSLPGASAILQDIDTTITDMLNLLDGPNPAAFLGQEQELDQLRNQLGDDDGFGKLLDPNIERNRLGALKSLTAAAPPSSSQQFVDEKVELLRSFARHDDVTWPEKIARQAEYLAQPGLHWEYALEAFFDTSVSPTYGPLPPEELERGLKATRNLLAEFSYDKIGTSYFQGLLYSNGNIRATNEVTVLGSLVAEGPVGEGKITLDNGSSVTFVEELFGSEEAALKVRTGLGVATWAGR